MPLSRLEIEQTAQDRWVAEVEVGGISNYRITVRGNTFAHVIAECERAYYEKRPDERPLLPDESGLPSDIPGLAGSGWQYTPKPKRVLSDEHKRAMAEGRARMREHKALMGTWKKTFASDGNEGPDAA